MQPWGSVRIVGSLILCPFLTQTSYSSIDTKNNCGSLMLLIFWSDFDKIKTVSFNVNNCPKNATIYSLLYFCKVLYMFRVITPPIIRSTYNCNYSIWHRLYCLPLSWRRWNWKFKISTTAEVSRDCLTSARCCNYSYMCSWWWVE